MREMLFNSDQVPTVEARLHLSTVCEYEVPRLVPFALGEVEYVVAKRGGGRVVAPDENGTPSPDFLKN